MRFAPSLLRRGHDRDQIHPVLVAQSEGRGVDLPAAFHQPRVRMAFDHRIEFVDFFLDGLAGSGELRDERQQVEHAVYASTVNIRPPRMT
jgi:hypothetical protein